MKKKLAELKQNGYNDFLNFSSSHIELYLRKLIKLNICDII